LSKRTIALKVAPEVSDLDRNNGVVINGFNIPAILTRRAETTVELGEGESFVIGGLISRNVTSNLRKFPVLADLPVLGAFFRSVEYEKQDKELLIIATPRFVKPRAKNAPSLALPGNQASDVKPGWGQMFLPSRDGSLPGFSR
jgi:pilus assembly protein CpaC